MGTTNKEVEGPITHLVIDEAQNLNTGLCVGLDGVVKINAYRESDGALWFGVYTATGLNRRINGKYVVEVGHENSD